MLVEFAQRIKNHCIRYDLIFWLPRCLSSSFRCLAHVINLATKALISTYSKAPFYNPKQADLAIPFENGHCDEVGLIQAIPVKVVFLRLFVHYWWLTWSYQACSSAQRKQLFRDIQSHPPPSCTPFEVFQLLLDMPVCWSSTYVMIERAEKKKKVSAGSFE